MNQYLFLTHLGFLELSQNGPHRSNILPPSALQIPPCSINSKCKLSYFVRLPSLRNPKTFVNNVSVFSKITVNCEQIIPISCCEITRDEVSRAVLATLPHQCGDTVGALSYAFRSGILLACDKTREGN